MWLAETVVNHLQLGSLRIVLATAYAHGLYERFGLRPVDAERMMERRG